MTKRPQVEADIAETEAAAEAASADAQSAGTGSDATEPVEPSTDEVPVTTGAAVSPAAD